MEKEKKNLENLLDNKNYKNSDYKKIDKKYSNKNSRIVTLI
jgi:hypothetical protein